MQILIKIIAKYSGSIAKPESIAKQVIKGILSNFPMISFILTFLNKKSNYCISFKYLLMKYLLRVRTETMFSQVSCCDTLR